MFKILTPILKRPAFWSFLAPLVTLSAGYFLEDEVDPTLLLQVIAAFLALIGIGSGAFLGITEYKKYSARKVSQKVELTDDEIINQIKSNDK